MEARRTSGAAAIVTVLATIAVLLPLLYVGAIGPLVWLNDRDYIHIDQQSAIGKIYMPLEWAAVKCEPFGKALQWYASLWSAPVPVPQPVQLHSY